MKAIILEVAVCVVLIVVAGFCYFRTDYPFSNSKVMLPYRIGAKIVNTDASLPAATDSLADAAAANSITLAKNQTLFFNLSRLQHKVRGQKLQKNAMIKFPTASNLKQHVSYKILRPVNWHLVDTINPYVNMKKKVSAGAKEIYFSVKTTRTNHATRLPVLILTWMQTVLSSQVWSGVAQS